MNNEHSTPTSAEPDTLTINLRQPVTFATIEHKAFTVREPTAAQMMEWDKLDGAGADIKAVAIVSGLPEKAVEQIGVRDLLRASRFINDFAIVAVDADEPAPEKVVTLRRPVTLGETTYRELRLREPKAIELIDWDQAKGVAADIAIVSAVSGVPEAAVRMIGARDLMEAGAYLAHFIAPSLQDGERS